MSGVSTRAVPRSRHVRVFVSSTFADMQAEREALVKVAFPELRHRCQQRGIVWGEVDLRWGIDEELQAEVLPRCLDEIADCHPFFIGLLGDRYGTVADEEMLREAAEDSPMADLLRREPWLADQTGVSLTEIEIMHGALRDLEAAPYCRFYFRDETAAEDERERRLKDTIRAHGLEWRPYEDPEELARQVVDDLWDLVDELYPEDATPDALAVERAYHDAVAARLVPRVTAGGRTAGVYVARADDFAALDAHVAGSGPPLAVTGSPGVGKSALIANWLASFVEAHPNALVISHYVGASPDSTDWAGTVRRLVGELQLFTGDAADIPDDPAELRTAFSGAMSRAAAVGKVILVLDGLDQLEDRDGAQELVWLPTPPAEVRTVLVTRPGRPLDTAAERSWPVLEVLALEESERLEVIDRYLDWWGKRLNKVRSNRIASEPACANPLFLSAVLNELRLFGGIEDFDQKLAEYLDSPSIGELFARVLKRYETDYERARPGLVGDAMTALAAARRGLTEGELTDVLGADDAPLPHAHWSPLHHAARPYLVNRSGSIGFAHPEFRTAVVRRYGKLMQQAHLRLANHFEQGDTFDPRRAEELPAQLAGAEEWARLFELLTDRDHQFVADFTRPLDLDRFWAILEAGSQYRRVDALAELTGSLDDDELSLGDILRIKKAGELLARAGHHAEALRVRRHLVDFHNQAGEAALMYASLVDVALSHRALGELSEALDALELCQRIELAHEVPDIFHGKMLNNLGMVLADMGRWRDALETHRAEEQLAVEMGSDSLLGSALGNQARALLELGNPEDALGLLEREERICRSEGDFEGLSHCLGNQAAVLIALRQFERARTRVDEHEQICSEIGDRAGVAMCAVRRAALAFEAGELSDAEALLDRAEAICAETGNHEAMLIGGESLRRAVRRRRGMDTDEYEATTSGREENAMRLKSRKPKADTTYADFTSGFAKAHEAGDSDKVWSLLQGHLVCPKCEDVVSPNLGMIESEKTMLVLCPKCEAIWIMVK